MSQDSLLKGLSKIERWKAMCIHVQGDRNKALFNKHLQKEWGPICDRAANKTFTLARKLVPKDTRELWRSIKKFHSEKAHQKGYRGMSNKGWFRKKSAVIVMISYNNMAGTLKTLAVERGRRPPEAGGYRRMDKQPFIGPAQKEVRVYFEDNFEKACNRAIKKAYNESKIYRDKPWSKPR